MAGAVYCTTGVLICLKPRPLGAVHKGHVVNLLYDVLVVHVHFCSNSTLYLGNMEFSYSMETTNNT